MLSLLDPKLPTTKTYPTLCFACLSPCLLLDPETLSPALHAYSAIMAAKYTAAVAAGSNHVFSSHSDCMRHRLWCSLWKGFHCQRGNQSLVAACSWATPHWLLLTHTPLLVPQDLSPALSSALTPAHFSALTCVPQTGGNHAQCIQIEYPARALMKGSFSF